MKDGHVNYSSRVYHLAKEHWSHISPGRAWVQTQVQLEVRLTPDAQGQPLHHQAVPARYPIAIVSADQDPVRRVTDPQTRAQIHAAAKLKVELGEVRTDGQNRPIKQHVSFQSEFGQVPVVLAYSMSIRGEQPPRNIAGKIIPTGVPRWGKTTGGVSGMYPVTEPYRFGHFRVVLTPDETLVRESMDIYAYWAEPIVFEPIENQWVAPHAEAGVTDTAEPNEAGPFPSVTPDRAPEATSAE